MTAVKRLAEDDARLLALEAELERRFRTTRTTYPIVGEAIEVLHPANADDLITEEDYVRDERLPYWADIWPSAVTLAGHLVKRAGRARRLLELGCGSGLATAAAAMAGFKVTSTDYYDDALLFAEVNAWRNAGVEIATRHVDWRDFPNDLGEFDLVVASDVLYEKTYAALLAHAFHRTLAPKGIGFVTDPGRIAAPDFVRECGDRGLRVEKSARIPFEAGAIKQTIDLYEITRPA